MSTCAPKFGSGPMVMGARIAVIALSTPGTSLSSFCRVLAEAAGEPADTGEAHVGAGGVERALLLAAVGRLAVGRREGADGRRHDHEQRQLRVARRAARQLPEAERDAGPGGGRDDAGDRRRGTAAGNGTAARRSRGSAAAATAAATGRRTSRRRFRDRRRCRAGSAATARRPRFRPARSRCSSAAGPTSPAAPLSAGRAPCLAARR